MVVVELAEPSAEGPAEPIETPTEQTSEQPSEHDDNITKTSALETIVDWVEEQGCGDFIYNWAKAIESNLLPAGNIAFLLFSELLKCLTSSKFQ